MPGPVDFLQPAITDLGVNLGGGQAGVAEQLLDVADIRAALWPQDVKVSPPPAGRANIP
jgi:hypothetical protein